MCLRMPELWPLEVAASPSTRCRERGLHPLALKAFVSLEKELNLQLLLAAPQQEVGEQAWVLGR